MPVREPDHSDPAQGMTPQLGPEEPVSPMRFGVMGAKLVLAAVLGGAYMALKPG
jgi:hypothetical protein